MIKHNQSGAASGLAVSIILMIMLIGAVVFGAWAYTSRQDYKDNVEAKVQLAEQAAIKQEGALKDKQFAEASKSPLKLYKGPESYGSLEVNYPKSWSGYVDDSNTSSTPVDGFFNSGVVPSTDSQNSVFALRVQVIKQPYASVLQTFSGQQKLGKLKASAYAFPKQPKEVGIQLTGEVSQGKTVTMVIVPLRSETLKVWTEGSQSVGDFNKYILPNFNFSP